MFLIKFSNRTCSKHAEKKLVFCEREINQVEFVVHWVNKIPLFRQIRKRGVFGGQPMSPVKGTLKAFSTRALSVACPLCKRSI